MYQVPGWMRGHCLHGGIKGLSRVLWRGQALSHQQVEHLLAGCSASPASGCPAAGVRFTYRSPHLEEGFPSLLECSVTYLLAHCGPQTREGNTTFGEAIPNFMEEGVECGRNGAVLHVLLEAHNVGPCSTPVNMTVHPYWNLNGDRRRMTVHNHSMRINADYVLATDAENLPTGRLLPVSHTALDFRYCYILDFRY